MANWYALIDAAQDPLAFQLTRQCHHWQCLVSGDLSPIVAATLPYLVLLDEQEPLFQAWQSEGWGQNWGIMLQSPLSIDKLRLHFKRFLYAQLPDGTVCFFRFYDPRVFRTYLVAASAEEKAEWFQGVDRFWVESHVAGRNHEFLLTDGRLYDAGSFAAS